MKKLLLLLLFPLTLFGQSQKISDMTSATSLTGSEYVPIVQTTNKKSTVTLLRGWASTIGTAGQLLKVNSGATALEFFTPTYLTSVGTGVANELTYWSGTSTLGSLATATYPSLTELSYVKGLTSAAQTQLGAKWPNTGSLSLTGTVNITGSQELNLGTYASPLYASYSAATAYVQGIVKATGDNSYLLNASGFEVNLNNPASIVDISAPGNIDLTSTSGSDESFLSVTPTQSNWQSTDGVNTAAIQLLPNVFKFLGDTAPSVGHVWTASNVDGTGYWAAPSGGGLTVGTSTITSGTNTRVLYNNSGTLGEYTVSGSGNVAMTTSPTFTTPLLGTPTSGTLTNTTGYLFNNLAAATGSNTINNAANAIEWQWNTLGAGTGLLLSSSSTAAASNTNTLFRVNQTGANATSTQTTYSGYFSNTKTGTSSTNVGIHAAASGGTTNYAGTFDGIIGQYDGAGANLNYMQVVGSTWRIRAAANLNLYVGSNILITAAARKITLGYSSGAGSGETQSLETLSGAWTSIPTTTELTDIIFNSNSATWTWDAGTTTTQRFNWFKGHTVNGGTLTNAYQLYVDAPIVGTGTITNNYAAGFGGNIIATGNAAINGSVTVGGSYTTQGQIIQNVGLTGSDVYRRNVEWTPVTSSGSSGNFDFNIFNTDVIQNSTCTVTITVTGVNSSGVKSYAKEMKATFRKPGTSDPVQVGSTTDIYEHSNDLTTPTSSVSASTDYCRVSYDSGTGAPTLQWTVFIETKYSTN